MQQQQREALWSVRQVAGFLNMGSWWVYTAAQNGTLPSIKVGKALRFDPAVVKRWVEARSRGPENPPSMAKPTAAAAG